MTVIEDLGSGAAAVSGPGLMTHLISPPPSDASLSVTFRPQIVREERRRNNTWLFHHPSGKHRHGGLYYCFSLPSDGVMVSIHSASQLCRVTHDPTLCCKQLKLDIWVGWGSLGGVKVDFPEASQIPAAAVMHISIFRLIFLVENLRYSAPGPCWHEMAARRRDGSLGALTCEYLTSDVRVQGPEVSINS